MAGEMSRLHARLDSVAARVEVARAELLKKNEEFFECAQEVRPRSRAQVPAECLLCA